MNKYEYRSRVIEFFKSGKATNEQWAEMADAIHYVSQSEEHKRVFMIDREVDTDEVED